VPTHVGGSVDSRLDLTRIRHLVRSAAPTALGLGICLTLFLGVVHSPQALAAAPTVAAAPGEPATEQGSAASSGSAAGSSQLAATPPMGFNTWNAFGCHINESTVRQIADTMVASGLRNAGYNYVNVDDCWGAPNRNSSGKLVANHARFPHGIKALAGYVHAQGMRFGIYGDAGTHTCNKLGSPGSLGHELTDARTFARWGVDYLKYDNCHSNGVPAPDRYQAMRNALNQVSRAIVYSICNWGHNSPWTWAHNIGNLWRTSLDIHDSWESMIAIVHVNQGLARFARPGHWNDPDLLEIGNPHMTHVEQRTQMSLWSMMAAPLLISTDLRVSDYFTIQTLKNPAVIAIDQDPLGKQATVIHSANGLTSYTKSLANGDRAVALLNETGSARFVRTTAAAAGLQPAPSYSLTGLWSGKKSTTNGTIRAWVPAHGTALYRVHPLHPPPAPGWTAISALTPTSAVNGWGPIELDMSNGGKLQGDGRTLEIAGKTYARGIGAHAVSRITYFVGGSCSQFVTDVGVDDEVGNGGSVRFQVLADGHVVAKTGILTGASAAQQLVVDLTGANQLTLVVTDAGDGIRSDHADWAHARVDCG